MSSNTSRSKAIDAAIRALEQAILKEIDREIERWLIDDPE